MPSDPHVIATTADRHTLSHAIGRDLTPAVQQAAARNPNATAGDLIVLSTSPDPAVVADVARHPNTMASTLQRLVGHPDCDVADTAADSLAHRAGTPHPRASR